MQKDGKVEIRDIRGGSFSIWNSRSNCRARCAHTTGNAKKCLAEETDFLRKGRRSKVTHREECGRVESPEAVSRRLG